MDDYAESLHISTNWFISNFKQYMKISLAQYILSLRMVNAQSLLENTDYNIGEIAEIVGYDNPLYFSRVFKKEYGVSPAQYRKNLEESTEKWERFLINKESRTMPIKIRSTANKSTTQRMNPLWQSRNFAWSGCMLIIIPALPNTQNGSSFWKKCLQSAAQAAGLSRRFTPIGAESTNTWAIFC